MSVGSRGGVLFNGAATPDLGLRPKLGVEHCLRHMAALLAGVGAGFDLRGASAATPYARREPPPPAGGPRRSSRDADDERRWGYPAASTPMASVEAPTVSTGTTAAAPAPAGRFSSNAIGDYEMPVYQVMIIATLPRFSFRPKMIRSTLSNRFTQFYLVFFSCSPNNSMFFSDLFSFYLILPSFYRLQPVFFAYNLRLAFEPLDLPNFLSLGLVVQ